MRAVLETEEVETVDALAGLEPAWWELWRRAPAATPFQSPAWLMPWWREFHPGRLFTIAVRHGDSLVGLAPLYIEEGADGRRILPIGISLTDYLDVLVDPVFAEPAAMALVAHVEREAARWDGCDLEELAPGAAALALPVPAGCSESSGPQSACPVLRLDAASLSEILPRAKRAQLNLARNRAARCGTVAIDAADAATAADRLDELSRLHGARWRSRGEAGVLEDDAVLRFQRAAVPGLMQAGLLRLYRLSIGGAPAAAHYGFVHRDRAYVYVTGFDPAFSFESPGVILYAYAIERALAEGAREFHFLRGQETYKYEWGAVDRWNRRRSFRPLDARRSNG